MLGQYMSVYEFHWYELVVDIDSISECTDATFGLDMDVVWSMQSGANLSAFIIVTMSNYFMWITTCLACCGLR